MVGWQGIRIKLNVPYILRICLNTCQPTLHISGDRHDREEVRNGGAHNPHALRAQGRRGAHPTGNVKYCHALLEHLLLQKFLSKSATHDLQIFIMVGWQGISLKLNVTFVLKI
jgi:hypothetical protein